MAKNTGMIVIIVAVVAILAVTQGWIDNPFAGGTTTGPSQEGAYPSDLETTITLNTKDALATTDTDATVNYYVFKSTGEYLKSGTTASGTASFTVNWAGDYEVLAFYDTGTKFYPESISFTANGGEGAQKTINMGLMPDSNATVNDLRDPVDLNNNVSVGLGQSVNFELIYSVTSASSAIKDPVIVFDVNQSTVSDISFGGLSKVTCPTRLTSLATHYKICFQDTTLKATEGVRTRQGAILFSGSTTQSTLNTEYMEVTILDTQMYADPNYASIGRSAFKLGTEDPNDNSNVGATDSQQVANVHRLYYDG